MKIKILNEAEKKEEPKIPVLIKKYMVKKYKFIGQPDSPGKGNEVEISGLEIAEEFWKNKIAAIWVTNEDEGMWERAQEHPEVGKIIDWLGDKTPKASPEPEQEDVGDKLTGYRWYLRIDGEVKKHPFPTKPGTHGNWKKYSAMDIARVLNSAKAHQHPSLPKPLIKFEVWPIIGHYTTADGGQYGGTWIDVAEVAEIEEAIEISQEKSERGIGTPVQPCNRPAPEDASKPFGDKQFDPYNFGFHKDEWECNTEIEQKVLIAISNFVHHNNKPEQEIADMIVKVALTGDPAEPLHPEEDIPDLFRGSSRENVEDALHTLQLIDWSSHTDTVKTGGAEWREFNFHGEFIMLYTVSSFTDDLMTSAKFAQKGPSLGGNPKARGFQWVYQTTPSAAKEVGGTFINFDELYKLQDNSRAFSGDFFEQFYEISDYVEWDKEILLVGKKGASMLIDKIWINWSQLTRTRFLNQIEAKDKSLVSKIEKLMNRKSEEDTIEDATRQFEKWYWDIRKEIENLDDDWDEAEDLPPARLKREFKHFTSIIMDLQERVEEVMTPILFNHKLAPWNQDEDHPWYKINQQTFWNGNMKSAVAVLWGHLNEIAKSMQAVAERLGVNTRVSPLGTISEEKQPWYKRWAAIEKKKGMRSKLTGANAGNKHIPATGMKNATTNDKSKSPPPGAGVLEEEPMPNSCSICGSSHEGPCHNPAFKATAMKLKIR